jgi:hypothetical protein
MSLHQKTINRFAPKSVFLYMLIDVTSVENTRILRVGDLERIQLHGRLYMAQGKKVIAPPVAGRGFSKLEKLPLQYLYWNTVGKEPPEDYGQLIKDCLAAVSEMTPCDEPIRGLHEEADKIDILHLPTGPVAPPPPVVIKAPKATTTTGVIWQIASEVLEDLYDGQLPADFKALRAEIVNRCKREGFNESTISVQYGKWKTAQLVTK